MSSPNKQKIEMAQSFLHVHTFSKKLCRVACTPFCVLLVVAGEFALDVNKTHRVDMFLRFTDFSALTFRINRTVNTACQQTNDENNEETIYIM